MWKVDVHVERHVFLVSVLLQGRPLLFSRELTRGLSLKDYHLEMHLASA